MTVWTDKVMRSGAAGQTGGGNGTGGGGMSGANLIRGLSALGRRDKSFDRAKMIGNGEGASGRNYRYRNALAKEYNQLLEQRRGLVGAVCAPGELCVPVKDKSGHSLNFYPANPDGNCGFKCLALGMTLMGAEIPSGETSDDCRSLLSEVSMNESTRGTSQDRTKRRSKSCKVTGDLIRKRVRDEVVDNRAIYDAEAMRNEGFGYLKKHCSVDMFCRSVVNTGGEGHWLGCKWGSMEIVAAARALGLCIELYTYDSETQDLRMYDFFSHGPVKVGLLFSGAGSFGHFDLLLHADARQAQR
mmetsp:Transcript_10901/g.29210  ORF Transcript_10901/g.29210 Transcript_10901/m.29210 type:complete len:300 (+) Transcript_10901:178-1077(+)